MKSPSPFSMAGSSNLLGKRKSEDDLETKPVVKKHKEKSKSDDEANLISVKDPDFAVEREKVVFVARLPRETEISDIINFFKDVGQVVRVQLLLGVRGNLLGSGLVEFASANEAKKGIVMKRGEYLHGSKIYVNIGAPYMPPKYCIDHKVWFEEYDETPQRYLEENNNGESMPDQVVLVANLSPYTTKIEHIINFFRDVGQVVSVRLIVNHKFKHVGYCFVEFACADQAKKALKVKNGKYLHDHPILLMMKGLDHVTTPPLFLSVEVRKTLFVAKLNRYTQISDIINFFKDVGQVVQVRLSVDHRGRHKCYGLVEFASADEARKALEEKKGEYLDGRQIYLDVLSTAQSLQPSEYCVDHKVWYEQDNLEVQESLEIEEEEEEEEDVIKKTVFFSMRKYTTRKSRIDKIIHFFRDFGKIVGVRLIADRRGKHVGCGYLEFASANEAKKALEKRNYGPGDGVYLKSARIARYSLRPKYNLANKLWYEDNLRRGRQPR